MLTGNDKWFCSKCSENVSALKKMQIYKLPAYLIVHFKRFTPYRSSFSGSSSSTDCRKIQKQIDFPIQNFDISRFCKNIVT